MTKMDVMSINIHRIFEYLFCADESSSFLNLRFENDVKMYGTQTMEQAVKMHFMAFQQFMKQTGGDIGLSLRLTTSYTAAMLKGSQEQSEKEEKLLKLLLPSGESNLTN